MKPTVESIMQQYNIRPYNGNWYVQESKLKEVLQKIVDGVYDGACAKIHECATKHDDTDYYEPVTRHFKD